MSTTMFHAAGGYELLMGRFLPTLAPAFADAAGVSAGQDVLDVGCGPGGLTAELAARVGAGRVDAIDPSAPFVAACRERVPGARVVEGTAEDLPYPAHRFDTTLASLVVGFMTDPRRGVEEMTRVTRTGCVVALCFWDVRRMQALGRFWAAARAAIDAAPADRSLVGAREGELEGLLSGAGLVGIRSGEIEAIAGYRDLDDLWSGYTAGVGPIGQYVSRLSDAERDRVRDAVAAGFDDPSAPFELSAVAWFAVGRVPAHPTA
ncbi:class I SAM-dependent methyltransferase [Microbacterium hydrocarbonoxydans]|uniref:class I SAM-dependent methyltransferase n=1 Tax=Microbacterium hydrocarbonoxydans TaxID=273678 RepID=UPI001AB04431|nr:class I SAM-dependent methyltransferase [Microbacterium hydrocarbonoxydans]